MRTFKNTNIVPYCEDLLDVASIDILKRYKHLLPDFRCITIFLPSNLAQKPLREKLARHALQQGFSAMLLPNFTSIRKWALSRYPPDKPLLSQYARELILVDAINQQSSLFLNANPWAIASELLSFFDAMSLNNIEPSTLQNHFDQHKQDTNTFHALSQEANLIMVLWQAWQQQLSHENMLDPVEFYVQALRKTEFSKQEVYYGMGLDELSECEVSLFYKIENQSHFHMFLYASSIELSTKPDYAIKSFTNSHTCIDRLADEEIPSYSKFLDSVFADNELSIKQRADIFSNSYLNSPVNKCLKVYKTNSFEHHVKALDIKIRSCIHDNKNNIAIVTADRKLVRRLRAVLEHANVRVNDLGGWALATTSAAVIIEFWLQLIEERYPAKQILALIKSPFLPISVEKEIHDLAINLFEKDIILAFNLHNGLNLFRNTLEQFQNKQEDKNEQLYKYLYQLFDKFETATRSLAKLHKQKTIPLHRFFEELINGLKTFGIYTSLNKDDAGKQVLELIKSQIAHFKNIENEMNWLEWRRFLTRILDQQNFKPPLVEANVTFCSLEQSRLLKFDALIIASVDKDHFPGASTNYIFFNEHIRTELHTPTWRDEHALSFYQFRRLLDAAPDVLITVQSEQNGEKITPSPWLEAIETFHFMAYEKDLLDKQLQTLVMQNNTSINHAQYIPLPLQSYQPSPMLAENLKPNSISISQYQRLMDCPYQFFTVACLKLSKTNELSEELEKSDFGSLVHKCIYAFFANEASMPGPFTEKVTTKNREAAELMLSSISKHIFSKYSERGFGDQLWLQHWLELIPKFIDWEIVRQQTHTPYKHEVSLQKNLNTTTSLNGRIDRIDKSDTGYAIIDYKTGQTPTQKSVLAGEQVQLPTYALLNENCDQVEYVTIGKDNNVKTESVIRGDELEELINEHHKRLFEFINTLNNEIHLTALADDETCDWCEVRGLCRKDYWQS